MSLADYAQSSCDAHRDAVQAYFTSVMKFTSARKADTTSPAVVRQTLVNASHDILSRTTDVVFMKDHVDRHFKRKAALDEATVKLERKRAAVGSAIDRLHGVVGELEDALCEARLELARPKPRLDVETVLTLAQRIGYSTSAPPRWRPGLQLKPYMFCAPSEEELRMSLLAGSHDYWQRFRSPPQ